ACRQSEVEMKAVSMYSNRAPAKWLCVVIFSLLATVLPYSVNSEQLYGSAELDQRLPSLDPTLAPGNTFDKEVAEAILLKGFHSTNDWYRIPNWIAGTWEEKESVTTFFRDEQTGETDETPQPHKSVSQDSWGRRKDRAGNVWDKLSVGYVTETIHENNISYNF